MRENRLSGGNGGLSSGDRAILFSNSTPFGTGDKPRAYSPVNIFGHVLGDIGVLKSVVEGATVTVSSGSER
jgi:hypothetical protein